MLPADVDEQLALVVGQRAGVSRVATSARLQSADAALLVRVQPPLERRHREGARDARAGHTSPDPAHPPQLGAQLPVVELLREQRSDDLGAELCHRLRVGPRANLVLHLDLRRGGRRSSAREVSQEPVCTGRGPVWWAPNRELKQGDGRHEWWSDAA